MAIKNKIKQKIIEHPEFPVLAILLAIYLFMANYFAYPVAFDYPFLNTSGGSDPYFNYYVINYILTYHKQLIYTKIINYPVGTYNYRPPFYMWSVVFASYIFSPFVGLSKAAYFAFSESDAFYAALLIIPVYLITKEIFGKKAGLIAAFLYTIMPSNLTAGILTDDRAHTPELIFAFLAIYFFEMAVKTAGKYNIINRLTDFKSYIPSIKKYFMENQLATVYSLLAAVSLGALINFWQGFPYIEVIILIYVAVQLIFNLFTKRPTGYLTYLTIFFIAFSFPFGYYYYDMTHMLMPWFYPPLIMGILIIGFGFVINIIGRKPWIITIPSIIIASALGLLILAKVNPVILKELITGDGYFVKSRLYSTIAEAAAPPLGFYIAGFGPGVFLLGIAGIPYILYKFIKTKSDAMLSIIIFSIFSIFMSFEAARFNITAAPAYAILGGGALIYFEGLLKAGENQAKARHNSMRKRIKTNITWLQASFVVIVILVLIIPSGMGAVSAAVPDNTASQYNSNINSSIPSFLRPNSTDYFGNYGFGVVNSTSPLSESFIWLASQDSNLPANERPAYLSWWDYGFQEALQGKHPAVADDFQQGYVSAGQVLLAQNQSDIVALFIARDLETPGAFTSGHFNSTVYSTLKSYFGTSEANNITYIYKTVRIDNKIPSNYTKLLSEPAYGGHQVNVTNPDNAYHALIMGELASKYSLNKLVNAYATLELDTGSKISYIQIDHGLFPFSGSDPGIFYAPAYLTDTPTYDALGEIVPTNYYNIFAVTSSGTYPLNKLPQGASVITYDISYAPAFYNSTIYRAFIGYSPSDVGEVNGIPGINYGTGASAKPAFNMSHFELVYYASLWSPYKNSTKDLQFIPIQEAYQYKQEHKGTVYLLPPISDVYNVEDPIIEYFPGANITGNILGYSGSASGIHVTLLDQYGIPHEVVTTNSSGTYNLVGLPGNDTLVFSTGSINNYTLEGSNIIAEKTVNVTMQEAEDPYTINLGSFNITHNDISGSVSVKNVTGTQKITSGVLYFNNSAHKYSQKVYISNGKYNVTDLRNYTYNVSVTNNSTKITYTNFTSFTPPLAKNITKDFTVNMDNLTVFVNSGGYGLSNFTIDVYNKTGNKIYTNYTDKNGELSIGLMPGNYTVKASEKENGIYANNTSYYNTTSWDNFKILNMVPEINNMVKGNYTANINLIGNLSSLNNVNVTLEGSNGRYYNLTSNNEVNITLPSGIYRISAYSSGYYINPYNNTIILNGTSEFNITYTDIKKIYNYTLYPVNGTDYAMINGSYYVVPFYLNNTGNTNITVNVNISNSNVLNKTDKIMATFANGKNYTTINIPEKTNMTLYVYLKPASGIKIQTYDKIDINSYYDDKIMHNATVSPEVQNITASGVGSSGHGVLNNYTKNPVDTLYIGIGIILGAMLIGLIGSTVRSRRGKK
ncbi:STT3 domain-containing protein [Acidiplasma sp.]|uniref:STT3 domain-containing protein n=1 Tax=Acidiplasma sp. TaxID=1872114 RepID=UPI003160F867